MKTERQSLITWQVDARSVLEPQFPIRGAQFIRAGNGDYIALRNLGGQGSRVNSPNPSSARVEEVEPKPEVVIVVPVDFSPSAAVAARVSASVGRHTHARIIFCHAIFPPSNGRDVPFLPWVSEALRSEARRQMQPLLEAAREAEVSATSVVEGGTPAGVILKVARRFEAALILLTPREHGAWARLLFGPSTAEQVAREAECHVMVVRHGSR